MNTHMLQKVIFVVAMIAALVGSGCGKREKTTSELIQDLKSKNDKDRLIAVRLLPTHKSEAVQVVPTLIEALKQPDREVRCSAAIGLGNLAEESRDAIPALKSVLKDRDARIREAARTALHRIDPSQFPAKFSR